MKSNKDLVCIIGIGFLLGIHWVSFFYSIQLSSVAIGLLSFSTFPIFTTLLEPLVSKERLNIVNLGIAGLSLVGIYFAVDKIDLASDTTKGALWGIFAGFTFAIIVIFNRGFVQKYSSITIAFYQDLSATILLAPLLFFVHISLNAKDVSLLILLGVIFTALGHVLLIKGTTHVKAQVASVIGSLEVVYGIVFAWLLLDERPTVRMIVGAVIVIGAMVIASARSAKSSTVQLTDP